jgi:hypothetical protein
MRRIPWLAVLVLAGLLVVTLPLASARIAPQQLGAPGVYLPLVFQGTGPTTAPLPTVTPPRIDFRGLLDELDRKYYVADDVPVSGMLLNALDDGVANITVTVSYTIDFADAGLWCTTITDLNGDWQCPDTTIPATWLNKVIQITAFAEVQGPQLVPSAQFIVVPDDPPPGSTLTPTGVTPPPPGLDCSDIPYRNFPVLPPNRHRFHRDGVECES